MKIAIITARGGSKRIHRKNIRDFRGEPVLAWPLRAAMASDLFDEIMVSTDDDEIAKIAQSLGASVPFMRSASTSSDTATTDDVLREVLFAYQDQGKIFETACCIYPTAVLTTADDLKCGYDQLCESDFDVVMPVARFSYPIWRSLRREENGRVSFNMPKFAQRRSQDLPLAFHDAGQWYWFDVSAFLQQSTIVGHNTGSIELPNFKVQDIDTEDDWEIAELKHRCLFG